MDIVKFSDVVNRVNEFVDKDNTDLEYYIGKGGSIDSDAFEAYPVARIKGATIGYKFHFGFKPGHILFMSRSFDQHKAATATFAGICSDSTYVVESKDENILLQSYLQVVMQSQNFWDWLWNHKTGGVNYLINYKTLAEYEFPLPSIAEQKIISDKVWAAYRLKESYKKLIAAIDEMVKSQFIEMFGKCDMIPFNKIAYINKASVTPVEGVTYTLFSFPAYDNNLSPEVVDGKEIRSSKIKMEENVILYNKLNVRLSRVWNINKLSTSNNICSSEFLPIKVKNDGIISQSFLYRVLSSEYVTNKMIGCSTGTSNSQKRISPKNLLNLDIPVPPLDLQNQFVTIAEQADKSKFELRKSIEAIDKVIKSLINNYDPEQSNHQETQTEENEAPLMHYLDK